MIVDKLGHSGKALQNWRPSKGPVGAVLRCVLNVVRKEGECDGYARDKARQCVERMGRSDDSIHLAKSEVT